MFQQDYTFQSRQLTCNKIRDNYPDRIPIIVTPDPKNKKLLLNKTKFLVPLDLTISIFLSELRHYLQPLTADYSLYLLLEDKSLPRLTDTCSQIYNKHKNNDGFLYMTCCQENVFG